MAMLPPDRVAEEDPEQLLDRVDALVLGGGADIDPETQGVEAHPETVGFNPDRDDFEIALAQAGAASAESRLLGVCRGMQILNIALRRHARPAHARPARPRAPPPGAGLMGRARRAHRAGLPGGPGRRDRGAHGEEPSSPGSRPDCGHPHGHGMVDGRRERRGDRVRDGDFVLGVLWHPEEDPADAIIPSLIARGERVSVNAPRAISTARREEADAALADTEPGARQQFSASSPTSLCKCCS